MTNCPQYIGTCRLCHEEKELRESHFLPKGLYRLLVRVSKTKNSVPIQQSSKGSLQTSKQATKRLLCDDCERRFDQRGENWMLRNIYRGHGRFRLREMIEATTPLSTSDELKIYSGKVVPDGGIDSLAYFGLSVFWRAAVCDWQAADRKYNAIHLGPFQEDLRKYLSGVAPFPDTAILMVVLSTLGKPPIMFSFPTTTRSQGDSFHVFQLPGVTFSLQVSRHLPAEAVFLCVARSEQNLIFVSPHGDRRLQRGALALMGKREFGNLTFPLTEGVV
jgi:hypothetical protein